MPLYRQVDDSHFVPFTQTEFSDLERDLETWIALNPHLLTESSPIVIFSRQPRTTHGKLADLLGIDETGACVVIELKRGETPRDVIAQTLEYAAWVDSLTLDDLNRLVLEYDGVEASSIADLYSRTFLIASDDDGNDETKPADRIVLNHRQRMIIVAQQFTPEVEETLRYLRTKLGVDISAVRFGIHKAGNETIIETEMVVGRERQATETERQPRRAERMSDEVLLERAQTDFMKHAVTAVEEWISNVGRPEIEVRHGAYSDHFIYIHGKSNVHYYYARRWLFCYLGHPSDQELDLLRQQLSKPDEVVYKEKDAYVRFHVATKEDLEILKQIILGRLQAD